MRITISVWRLRWPMSVKGSNTYGDRSSIGGNHAVENSTAGIPPKTFAGQTVELTHEPDTIVTSVDGRLSTAHHPSTILWHGGVAKDFANITDVKIVGNNGQVLIDGELNRLYEVPRDVAGGVLFLVLRWS